MNILESIKIGNINLYMVMLLVLPFIALQFINQYLIKFNNKDRRNILKSKLLTGNNIAITFLYILLMLAPLIYFMALEKFGYSIYLISIILLLSGYLGVVFVANRRSANLKFLKFCSNTLVAILYYLLLINFLFFGYYKIMDLMQDTSSLIIIGLFELMIVIAIVYLQLNSIYKYSYFKLYSTKEYKDFKIKYYDFKKDRQLLSGLATEEILFLFNNKVLNSYNAEYGEIAIPQNYIKLNNISLNKLKRYNRILNIRKKEDKIFVEPMIKFLEETLDYSLEGEFLEIPNKHEVISQLEKDTLKKYKYHIWDKKEIKSKRDHKVNNFLKFEDNVRELLKENSLEDALMKMNNEESNFEDESNNSLVQNNDFKNGENKKEELFEDNEKETSGNLDEKEAFNNNQDISNDFIVDEIEDNKHKEDSKQEEFVEEKMNISLKDLDIPKEEFSFAKLDLNIKSSPDFNLDSEEENEDSDLITKEIENVSKRLNTDAKQQQDKETKNLRSKEELNKELDRILLDFKSPQKPEDSSAFNSFINNDPIQEKEDEIKDDEANTLKSGDNDTLESGDEDTLIPKPEDTLESIIGIDEESDKDKFASETGKILSTIPDVIKDTPTEKLNTDELEKITAKIMKINEEE